MTSASYPFAQPTFGKRLTPPLMAEQKAQLAAAARDAELQAMLARMKADHEAYWEKSLADAWADLQQLESAIAGRRLGAVGGDVMQGLAGFCLGLRLGR